MVLLYSLGVFAQCLASLGLALWTLHIAKVFYGAPARRRDLIIAFGLGMIIESTLLGLLSFLHTLEPWLLQSCFAFKCSGILLPILNISNKTSSKAQRLKPTFASLSISKSTNSKLSSNIYPWLFIAISALLLLNACVPTASFDNFSAHFPIPKLFIEARGYPHRPDFQYLDALPLGAQLWFILPFQLNLEGAANAISPIFTIGLWAFIRMNYGKAIALYSLLICCSIPEFLRVSLDPMVDSPCIFFAVIGYHLLRSSHKEQRYLGFTFWCFLVSIKPTMLPFPLVAYLWILSRETPKNWAKQTLILALLSQVGLIWLYKNAWVHHNPFYPHLWSPEAAPLIPNNVLEQMPNPTSLLQRVHDYFFVLFAEKHYNLSLGFWPLASLPILLLKAHKRPWLWITLAFGLWLTFSLTPFKNRYALPFLFLLLPLWSSLALHSHRSIKGLIWLTASINTLSIIPYTAQPLLALAKNLDVDEYYRFKFYNYSAYEAANRLPEGRLLLIGQASHWIKRDHQLSVISETHLDYTRLESLEGFIEHLRQNDIAYIVFDRSDITGMSKHPQAWYVKKAYCAQRALHWVDQLLAHPKAKLIQNIHGVDLIDTTRIIETSQQK